jgi:formate dehydrogenase beta subunit
MPAPARRSEERQARRLHRRRPGLADGGARSLPLGYEVTVFDGEAKAGGMMRTQIPRFRLPEEVCSTRRSATSSIMGVECGPRPAGRQPEGPARRRATTPVFVGSGAPRGRDLDLPGRKEGAANIHVGIDWLANVAFGHVTKIGKRVIVLGGGNTAMDCCRTSRRLGGEEVKVIVAPASTR